MGETARFLGDYIVLPECGLLVVAAWVAAAWLVDVWDRFPHLAVNSPEKRCGKTTLLDLLALVVPRPRPSTNISPAALYRVIELERPTLLLDEAQSITRRGSEASEVIREILNAGIGKNARVTRCGGANRDQIEEFSIYSPKVFAFIGPLDSVLADRSLPIALERKTAADAVQRFRSRVVEPKGQALRGKLEEWAGANREKVAGAYDTLEPFDIDNDRMAELLLPLQAVLAVAGKDGVDGPDGISGGMAGPLAVLEEYAKELDARDREQEMQTPGVRLLAACRESFCAGVNFLPTLTLINLLVNRREEPWFRWNKGEPLTDEALARLLRPFGIRPARSKDQQYRGYYRCDFAAAWGRYLPPALPPENPANPPDPSTPAAAEGGLGPSAPAPDSGSPFPRRGASAKPNARLAGLTAALCAQKGGRP